MAIVVSPSSLSLYVAPVGAGAGTGVGRLGVAVLFGKSAVGIVAAPLFAARAALASIACAVAGLRLCTSWFGVAGAPEIFRVSGGNPV